MSKSGSKASAAHVGDRSESAHCLGAGKSGRVDGCQALGPGYSRRKKADPSGLVGMNHPFRWENVSYISRRSPPQRLEIETKHT